MRFCRGLSASRSRGPFRRTASALVLSLLISLLGTLAAQAVETDEVARPRARSPRPPPLGRLALLVRDRLKACDGDQEIIDFIVARYGEFVLLKPRFAPHTLLLGSPRPRRSSRRF
jgi:cytochrome c-type biogenesis protein CcmH